MEATATVNFDRAYFELYYSEWLRYRNRWRRFVLLLPLLLIAAGTLTLVFLHYLPGQPVLGIALIAIGILWGVDIATHRSRWLRGRLRNLPKDKCVSLVFHDDEIQLESPHSQGTLRLAGFSEVVATPNGLFLIPQSGVSIFVPRGAIRPEDAFPRLVECLKRKVGGSAA